MRGIRLPVSALSFFLLLAPGCSTGPDLDDFQREAVSTSLETLTEQAAIALGPEDLDCVVSELSTNQAFGLLESHRLDTELSEPVARGIVSCIGTMPIMAAVIAAQAPEAGDKELDCAISEVDEDLVITLVSSFLEASPLSRPAVELSVASALAFCLDPQNLLDQG